MAQIITSISFSNSEPAYKVYKVKFEDNEEANFSAWIKKKLIEEAQQENNPDFLRNEIAQREALQAKVQSELAFYKKQLDKTLITHSDKISIESQGNVRRQRKFEGAKQLIRSDYIIPEEEIEQVSIEWIDLDKYIQEKHNIRTLNDFMTWKGYKQRQSTV